MRLEVEVLRGTTKDGKWKGNKDRDEDIKMRRERRSQFLPH